MKIYTEEQNGTLRILLTGELDHHCAKSLMQSLDSVIDEYLPSRCVLDIGSLNFMDSSGIAVILRVNKRMTGMGGQASVENAEGQPLKVLEAAGLRRILGVFSKAL